MSTRPPNCRIVCSTPGCKATDYAFSFFICKSCALEKVGDPEKLKKISAKKLATLALCGPCLLHQHGNKNHGLVGKYQDFLIDNKEVKNLERLVQRERMAIQNRRDVRRGNTTQNSEPKDVDGFEVVTHQDCI